MRTETDLPLRDKRILVLDGEQRSALAVVRSLAIAGANVEVVESRSSISSASKHCQRAHLIPKASPTKYVQLLRSVLAKGHYDLFVPCTDVSLRTVYEASPEIPVLMPYANQKELYDRLSNKFELSKIASTIGICVPNQRVIHTLANLEGAIAQISKWPVVVKPARSVGSTDQNEKIDRMGILYANSASELHEIASRVPQSLWPIMLQDRIVGPGIGIFLLRFNGRIVARFAHRRLREKPPTGGVSVYSESIPYPPLLGHSAEQLLNALEWEGPAMVEFKCDSQTGDMYIMEINGRFWGSLQLAVDAGVPFPALAAMAALKLPIPDTSKYKTGVRLRWLLGDLDHLFIRLKGTLNHTLPPDAPDNMQVVKDFAFNWRVNDRSNVFRFSDPMPGFRELLDWVNRRE